MGKYLSDSVWQVSFFIALFFFAVSSLNMMFIFAEISNHISVFDFYPTDYNLYNLMVNFLIFILSIIRIIMWFKTRMCVIYDKKNN